MLLELVCAPLFFSGQLLANHGIHTLRGPRSGDQFGVAVAAAGDVDGDSIGDWIIGAPATRVGRDSVGRVVVVSVANHSTLHQWFGATSSLRLGGAVAGAGDLDLDGTADLLIGSPYGGGGHGEVRVHSGASGNLLRTLRGSAPGDQFGRSVSRVADTDGDGVDDLLVGAPHSDGGGTNAGELSLFSGSDGALLRTHAGGTFDQLGFSSAGVGDLNGDGRGDYAIGIPFSDVGAFNSGEVVVHSGIDGAVLFRVPGLAAGDQFGFALSAGEDVDGDGTPDLVTCAPAADANGFDSGAAYVLSGQDGSILHVLPGPAPGTYLSAIALLGDVHGDGHAEILTGCPGFSASGTESGQVELFSGADGSSQTIFPGPRALSWFGSQVAAGGDVNGDGRPDFLVGAPGHQDHSDLLGFAEVLSPIALP